MGEKWDRNNFDVNNIFDFQVALDIIQNDDDLEPRGSPNILFITIIQGEVL